MPQALDFRSGSLRGVESLRQRRPGRGNQGSSHPSGRSATLGIGWFRMLGLYWGYIGIMEKKMETTIIGFRVI